MDRIKLKLNYAKILHVDIMEIVIPGNSRPLVLAEHCNCVRSHVDSDEYKDYYTAAKGCPFCNGAGINVTEAGRSILKFVEYFNRG